MSSQAWTRDFWTRGAVVAALVVLAAVGFCIFDADHDGNHHAGSLHVCLAMLAASLARSPFIELLVVASAVILSLPRLTAVTLGVPVPPPKSTVSL